MGEHLNRIHATNFSAKNWRVILGPWLIAFVPALLDRYKSIQVALKDSASEKIFIASCHLKLDEAPNEMNDFLKELIDPSWNERLYLQIIHEMKASALIFDLDQSNSTDAVARKPAVSKHETNLLKRIFYRGMARNKHAFSTTYISPGVLRRLQISLKQLPLTLPQIPLPVFETDFTARQSKLWEIKFDRTTVPKKYTKFISLLERMIPMYIPKSYLEGFKFIQQLPSNHNWPTSVKTIVTATAIYNDEVFKIWAASESEKGAKLILAQHGGNYGTSLFHSREEHELSISDKYLTWGWRKEGFRNIEPIGNFRNNNKTFKQNISGKALIGLTQGNDYASFLQSTPVSAGQWDIYQENQLDFIQKFSPDFSSNLRVRLYPSRPNSQLRSIWQKRFPEVTLDKAGITFEESLRAARIYIGTDNNTTWLNTLNSNFPTIVVMNPLFWEVRPEAEPFFFTLEQVGIFHRSTTSAAAHLESIWGHLEEWWMSELVQNSRLKFTNQFSCHNSSFYKSIRNAILELDKE